MSHQQDEQEEEHRAIGGREGGSMNFPSHLSSVSLTHHCHSSSISFTDLMVAALAEEANTETESSEV